MVCQEVSLESKSESESFDNLAALHKLIMVGKIRSQKHKFFWMNQNGPCPLLVHAYECN